jgi:small subunit ribosomal protein SAe
LLTDPKCDQQAVIEASYVSIPTIALCNTDAPLDFIDVVIPCNNRITNSISMIYWMLAREVKYLRGELPTREWDVMVDLFISRDIEKIKAEQQRLKDEAAKAKEDNAPEKFDKVADQGQIVEDWNN